MEYANSALAGRNEGSHKDKPPAKKGDGQQASSPAQVTETDSFRAPIDGWWHCGGAHMQVRCLPLTGW